MSPISLQGISGCSLLKSSGSCLTASPIISSLLDIKSCFSSEFKNVSLYTPSKYFSIAVIDCIIWIRYTFGSFLITIDTDISI
jgi:hypothetical protein